MLFADDSASVCLSVRLLLQTRHKGLTVREAVDGLDAIERPVILFTLTDIRPDAALGVDFISKTDGIAKLIERVDALLPGKPADQGATLW